MKKLILSAFLFLNILFISNINFVKAESLLDTAAGGFGAGYDTTGGEFALQEMAGRFINVFLSLLGVIFTCLIIYAGYLWMMARGNEEEVKKSKDLMINATIGLAIVIAAYALTYFILSSLTGTYTKDSSL
jgi:cytochrome bd-type quinol oxidase subunit 2